MCTFGITVSSYLHSCLLMRVFHQNERNKKCCSRERLVASRLKLTLRYCTSLSVLGGWLSRYTRYIAHFAIPSLARECLANFAIRCSDCYNAQAYVSEEMPCKENKFVLIVSPLYMSVFLVTLSAASAVVASILVEFVLHPHAGYSY